LIKSYFDLKEFIGKVDIIYAQNKLYNKLRTLICLYSLGKFTENEARSFYTNDYFTESVGSTNICVNLSSIQQKIIAELNEKLLIHVGIDENLIKKLNNEKKSPLELSELICNEKKYIYFHSDSTININNIKENSDTSAKLAEEVKNYFSVEIDRVEFIKLFVLVRNLLLFLGYLSPSLNDYSAENKAFLQKNGYLVLDNFVSKNMLEELKSSTYKIASEAISKNEAYLYGEGLKAQRIYNLIGKSKLYRDFLLNDKIKQVLDNEFSRNTLHSKYYLSSFQANILYPGAKAQVLHTDLAIPEPLPPWLIRLNVNLLLDDFTENNGATILIPGSHKYLHKPEPDLISNKMIKVLAPAGSLVIWTGHLWHKSGENSSSNSRAALLACFAASHFREIAAEENYLVINNTKLRDFDPKILELIGANHGIKKGNF